jgi:hypothetical protein
LILGGFDPGFVHELGIDRNTEQLAVALGELRLVLMETQNLGRADESEVERVEQQINPLTLEIAQLVVLELTVVVALEREARSGLTHETHGKPSRSLRIRLTVDRIRSDRTP